VLYAAVVGTAALLSCAMLAGSLRRGHVRAEERERAREVTRGALRPALVFLVSIPPAFLSPVVAQLSWLALLVQVWPRRSRS
jgi:hypothetical protein